MRARIPLLLLLMLSFTLTAAAKDPPAAPSTRLVAKAVFVDKKNACPCVRRAIEASWEDLQNAVGEPAKVPVERLHIDTERAKVEPYEKLRPITELPAIYFLDTRGGLVELLQGEVTAAQITKVLKR